MAKASERGHGKKPVSGRQGPLARKVPLGRAHADFVPLRAAEKKLLEGCATGQLVSFSDKRPEAATEENAIRAAFLRFLVLGGDSKTVIHERGIFIQGAFVEGELDLQNSEVTHPIFCWKCCFTDGLLVLGAKLKSINLAGSSVPSILGDSLRCERDFFLRNGFSTTGAIRLVGARIGGDLSLSGSRVGNSDGIAIALDGGEIGGSVFLTDNFVAEGCVRLHRVRIRAHLLCQGGSFLNSDGSAFGLEAAVVEGILFFRHLKEVRGTVSFCGSRVNSLCDHPDSWTKPTILDGFTYDRIDSGPTDAEARIKWLNLQDPGSDGSVFWPQPWEQLSKVLREMGHGEDAKLIAMEKQRELRRRKAIGSRKIHADWKQPWIFFDGIWVALINPVARFFHVLYGALAGYGHRPVRTLVWIVGAWALGVAVYHWGEGRGVFGPTAPLLLTSKQFETCGSYRQNGSHPWTRCHDLPPEHTRFSPFMYSADVILPLVDLRQEADWAPIVQTADGSNIWEGEIVRVLMWAQILFGWITSLLLASAAGRLVQKD